MGVIGKAAEDATDPPLTLSSGDFTVTIETAVRFVVRFVALFVLAAHWTYRAGVATGRFVHRMNDWLTAASKTPLATATRLAEATLTWAEAEMAEPQPKAEPSLAEAFAANCAAMAASDARLYRAAGERITAIRSILDEAEAAPAKPKRVARRKPVTAPAKPKRTARQKPAEAPKAEAEA